MKFKRTLFYVVPFLSLASVSFSAVGIAATVPAVNQNYTNANAESYDDWLATWSKENHLYIHYNRGESADDYSDYCLWLWQHAPKNIAGSLWAYSGNTQVSPSIELVPMSTSYMTGSQVHSGGSEMFSDGYGAIIDVDLGADIKSGRKINGKDEGNASLTGATELGFLMVLKTSMGGGHHWTSDGGKETYLANFDKAPKINGAVHVYLNTGDFDSYAYESSKAPAPRVNPTTADTTGEYRSQTSVIADGLNKPVPATSDEFKSLGVGYQVFVASFRDSDGDGYGDLRGVINSLDYFKNLGVQCLWLTPIQKSDSYHGYDISDYYAVDPRYGKLADYRELIYKAHEKGIKVIMDLVVNHTSKNNVWFKNSQWAKEGVDENGNKIEWRNVYHWKYETDKVNKWNGTNWDTQVTVKQDAESGEGEAISWYRDGLSHYYYYGKFGSGMPEINYEYQPTRDLVKNMAKYWLSFGLDGFRLDAVKHIYMKDEVANTGSDTIIKDVGTRTYFDSEKGRDITVNFDYSSDLNKNVTWWKEFATELKSTFPNCFLVGENFDGYGNRTAAYYQGLDSQFGFNHYYHIASYLYKYGPGSYANKEPTEGDSAFRGTTAEYWVDNVRQADLPGGKRSDYIDGSFTSNHDVMRAINHVNYSSSTATETTDNVCVTGTAAQIARAKVMGAMTVLQPGLSWIYYGDELGMSSNTNEHVTKYGNNNSIDIWYRQPMKWGGDAANEIPNYEAGAYKFEWDSYNKTLKNTEEQAASPSSMLRYYQALGKIKNLYPKNAKVNYRNDGNVMWFDITGDSGKKLMIFINPGQWDSDYYPPNYTFTNQLQGYTRFEADDAALGYSGGNLTSSLPAAAIGVWYK